VLKTARLFSPRPSQIPHTYPDRKRFILVSAAAESYFNKLLDLRRAFVEHQPVHSELPGGFREVVEVDRLADVAVDPDLIAADQVALLIGR